MHVEITDAHLDQFIPAVRELFREYSTWLEIDLSFQNFETKLANLPGKYAPPAGAILLAYADNELAGCVALRPLAPAFCEMKRLWVRPPFRNLNLGQQLVQALLDRARSAGHAYIRLDTLAPMKGALALYRKLGFYDIPPYYPSPLPDAIYLEKRLV